MSTLYNRRVINDPHVRLAFSDPLVGLLAADDVDLVLDNADGYFDARDVRGERITYSRFDQISNETWEEITGTVEEQILSVDTCTLRTKAHNLPALQTLLPKELVTAATFPKADPEQGLGRPIPIVFGVAGSTNKVNDAWELPWVGDDTAGNLYDYLLGRGTFSNVSVYRDTVGGKLFLVPGSEYTVNTAAYPGFSVIRFTSRQRIFGGGFHRIFAAADPATSNRNFADATKFLLNDATQGLGLSVNAASFTTAASDLPSGLYCDGAITEQHTALDWITQLLIVRGMSLGLNSSGEHTLAVDKAQSAIKGRFGHGLSQTWNGLTENGFKRYSKTAVGRGVKSLVLEYRKDRYAEAYLLATSVRSVLAAGEDRRIQHDFIRDRTTGDKVNAYLANRYLYGDGRLSIEAGQRARKLRPGELIQYKSTRPTISATFRVIDIGRGLTQSSIEAEAWSSAIYDYAAGTLPAEPAANTDTDWSRSTPTAVTGLSIVASGVETDGQNAYLAKVTLQYTVPAETWAQTYVRVRRNGTTNWETVAQDTATGASLQTQITGLITGASYDYMVERVNVVNPILAASASLTAQTAPADATGPAAPTSPAIVDQHLKTITFEWTAPADKDVAYYHWEIRTGASGGGTLVDEGNTEGPGTKVTLTLNQIAYTTTRHLRVRGHDFSGNTGTYSASLGFSFSKVVTVDIDDNQITTPKIPNNAVTAHGGYSNDASQNVSTTETEVGTLTISTNGGAGYIIGKLLANDAFGSALFSVRLRKDSITGTVLDFIPTKEGYEAIVMGYDSSPSATQTYKLTAHVDAGTRDVFYRRLIPINFKK